MRVPVYSLFIFFFLVTVAACTKAPYTERSQFILISESQAAEMGATSFQEILRKEKISQDPKLKGHVQKVLDRIGAATGREDLKWEFAVIENKKLPNAFALPGGKVAVYTGILPYTQDETGLATVIGHEVAHVIARHGAERVSQQLVVQLGLVAVQAAMSSKDPATVERVSALLGAGAAVGVILPFSRAQEAEADRLGLIYMAKAGYDPCVAPGFWRRMQKASKGGKPPEFLSTHPHDENRIKQIERWIPEAMRYYRREK